MSYLTRLEEVFSRRTNAQQTVDIVQIPCGRDRPSTVLRPRSHHCHHDDPVTVIAVLLGRVSFMPSLLSFAIAEQNSRGSKGMRRHTPCMKNALHIDKNVAQQQMV